MFRLCFNKVYGNEKDAQRDLKKVIDSKFSPKVIKGRAPDAYLIEIFSTKLENVLEEVKNYCDKNDIKVFRYE